MYIFDTFSKYLFLGFKVHYVHFRAFLLKIFFDNLKIVNHINFATKVSNHKGLRIKFAIFLIRLYCKMNFMIPLHNVYFSPTTIKRLLCSFPSISISLTGRNNVHSPRTIILLICYGRPTSLLLKQ